MVQNRVPPDRYPARSGQEALLATFSYSSVRGGRRVPASEPCPTCMWCYGVTVRR